MELLTISPLLVQLPCLMAKTACIWNPLVYVCHNSQFRDAFIDRFHILRRFKKEHIECDAQLSGEARDMRVKNHVVENLNLHKQISQL